MHCTFDALLRLVQADALPGALREPWLLWAFGLVICEPKHVLMFWTFMCSCTTRLLSKNVVVSQPGTCVESNTATQVPKKVHHKHLMRYNGILSLPLCSVGWYSAAGVHPQMCCCSQVVCHAVMVHEQVLLYHDVLMLYGAHLCQRVVCGKPPQGASYPETCVGGASMLLVHVAGALVMMGWSVVGCVTHTVWWGH